MTVPEIIANVLDKIRRDFYGDARIREFMRDQRQLMKAIATYGYECNERGWNFEPDFIYQELMKLLLEIRTAEADVQYLPVYLAGAIRRHIGQRAEELSAKAKQIDHKVASLIAQVGQNSRSAVREPKPVEVLAEMYKGIKQIQRARRRKAHAAKAAKSAQGQLL